MSKASDENGDDRGATTEPAALNKTIEELYESVKASGFRSPSESTQIVREMRDARTRHLAKFIRD